MKALLRKLRRLFVWLLISPIYWLGCLCYDKKYLTGRHFNRWHFSRGWEWILRYWFGQKILGHNREVPWPVPPHIGIAAPQNIRFDPDDMQNFLGAGSYFQGLGGEVVIGKGSVIASGVGLITANHDPAHVEGHLPGASVVLGESCWIAKNAVVLPGIHLGPHTVVGAGAVVTKSFPEGWCVLVGNPAKKIKELPYEKPNPQR